MHFRFRGRGGGQAPSPEALFRDIRDRNVEGLLVQQGDVLRSYIANAVDAPDVALEMPTGSGKTLVGLLIAEWRRRTRNQRALFLCPTNQLVNQVVEQAREGYGIQATAFTGPHAEYNPDERTAYLNAETVGVTSYSSLFNIAPFFEDPRTIVLDDVHAAAGYISDLWTLRIGRTRDRHVFEALTGALRPHLTAADYHRLVGDRPDLWDPGWVDKVPTPTLMPLIPELVQLLDESIPAGSSLRFGWRMLRDHIAACHLYLSDDHFLIRPLTPPTRTHTPFSGAEQRVYMSATLGAGGDLERITGVRRIQRISIENGWDEQGFGRRLFLLPMRSLSEEEALTVTVEMIGESERALVLAPSEKRAEEFRDRLAGQLEHRIFSAREIEASKREFVETNGGVAVVANRYDGIDLPGDECRLLVIYGLPRATNLQEQFLIYRLGAVVLYNDRILTRIVQATGRCTRSATDYATVVLLGEELYRVVLNPELRSYLQPEIQAELEFGVNESRNVDAEAFLEFNRLLLDRTEEWADAEAHIVSRRDVLRRVPLPAQHELSEAVSSEVDYVYAMWGADYDAAVAACRSVLGHLDGDELRGYRALWYYLAGSAAGLAAAAGNDPMAAISRDFFGRATAACTGRIRWLAGLARQVGAEAPDDAVPESLLVVMDQLERELDRLGTIHDRDFNEREGQIRALLASADGEEVERGVKLLGDFIGYHASNSDGQAAPDPWWCAGEDWCLVFEVYSEPGDDQIIGARKVRQLAGHRDWLVAHGHIADDVDVISVLLTRARRLQGDAAGHARGLYYWRFEDFLNWSREALATVREVRNSFPGVGDLIWRTEALRAWRDNGLDPAGITAIVQGSPLDTLPTAG